MGKVDSSSIGSSNPKPTEMADSSLSTPVASTTTNTTLIQPSVHTAKVGNSAINTFSPKPTEKADSSLN